MAIELLTSGFQILHKAYKLAADAKDNLEEVNEELHDMKLCVQSIENAMRSPALLKAMDEEDGELRESLINLVGEAKSFHRKTHNKFSPVHGQLQKLFGTVVNIHKQSSTTMKTVYIFMSAAKIPIRIAERKMNTQFSDSTDLGAMKANFHDIAVFLKLIEKTAFHIESHNDKEVALELMKKVGVVQGPEEAKKHLDEDSAPANSKVVRDLQAAKDVTLNKLVASAVVEHLCGGENLMDFDLNKSAMANVGDVGLASFLAWALRIFFSQPSDEMAPDQVTPASLERALALKHEPVLELAGLLLMFQTFIVEIQKAAPATAPEWYHQALEVYARMLPPLCAQASGLGVAIVALALREEQADEYAKAQELHAQENSAELEVPALPASPSTLPLSRQLYT